MNDHARLTPSPAGTFRQPLSFGAELQADGTTRFRLWAPSLEVVSVEIDGAEPTAMLPTGDGWFEARVPCGAGTRYRHRVSPDLAVPDPASRAQAGGVHGDSVVVDPTAYRWRLPAWKGRPWPETVLYELHAGLLGGYRGVAERLPQLAEIGITAVELMPISEFPGDRNWGYDGVLPYAPQSSYGTPDDLKALVDRAHELGLMIFLDVVYNHFGPDGNYISAYAEPFFSTDPMTPWGPSINFAERPVRDYFIDNALYWINEYRFDGLRFDAVHAIPDRGFLEELADKVRAGADPDRHVHLVLENDDNAAGLLTGRFDAQWNDDGHHVLHTLLTAETEGYYSDYADAPAEALARVLTQGFVYQGEPSAHRGGIPRGEPSDSLPPTAFVLFLQNHDQIGNRAFGEPITALAPSDALDAAQTLHLLSPQIPLLFMGEEVRSTTPFLFFTNHGDELAELVREGRRKEFASFAAFASEEGRARIPDPNAVETFEASRPAIASESPGPWRDRARFVAKLAALRAEEIAPRLEGARAIGAEVLSDKAVCARWRLGDGTVLTIATNLGPDPIPFDPPDGARLLAASREDAAAAGGLAGMTTLVWLGGEAA